MGRVKSVEYLIMVSAALLVCIIPLILWSPMAFATTVYKASSNKISSGQTSRCVGGLSP